MRRLLALLLVALGLAPGTWWRAPAIAEDERQTLAFVPLEVAAADLGPLELAGAWELRSGNRHFGSFSALVALGDGTLLSASDSGRMLRFTPPGVSPRIVRFDYFAGRAQPVKRLADVEALALDRDSGRLWAAYEFSNRIERHERDFASVAAVAPTAMRTWSANAGPEAMTRLDDGRFIVLAEGAPEWFGEAMPGLLFPADPLAGTEPLRFRFVPPDGFRPVDLAQLPDGRVVILLRRVEWRILPGFSAKLMVADPGQIREGRAWPAQPVADLADPLPTDNYEGLAIERDDRGNAVLWVISDDNEMALQRTLLLKLVWPANAKARGIVRAPR